MTDSENCRFFRYVAGTEYNRVFNSCETGLPSDIAALVFPMLNRAMVIGVVERRQEDGVFYSAIREQDWRLVEKAIEDCSGLYPIRHPITDLLESRVEYLQKA